MSNPAAVEHYTVADYRQWPAIGLPAPRTHLRDPLAENSMTITVPAAGHFIRPAPTFEENR
jgi:hypothetical protein